MKPLSRTAAILLSLASAMTVPRHAEAYVLGQVRRADGTWSNLKWNRSMPIPILVDQGSCWEAVRSLPELQGRPDAQQRMYEYALAQVNHALSAWSSVPSSSFRWAPEFVPSAPNVMGDGINELRFFVGEGNSHASIKESADHTELAEVHIKIQASRIDEAVLPGVLAQEIGHALGLGHSMVSVLFSPTTNNASVSITVNMYTDGHLSPDDEAAVAFLYPAPGGTAEETAQSQSTGTILGTVRTEDGIPVNGGCVMAVRFSTGGAMVGRVSGVYEVPIGATDLRTQGSGRFDLRGLPAGTYVIAAFPFRNYLRPEDLTRVSARGFSRIPDDDDPDTDSEHAFSILFTPGIRLVEIEPGRTLTVNFDGNSGDADLDERLTRADVSAARSYLARRADGGAVDSALENRLDLDQNGFSKRDIQVLSKILASGRLVRAINRSVFSLAE